MTSEEPVVSTRVRLSALWATLVLLYLYADVLSLFRPGQIGVLYIAVSAVNLVGEAWAYYLLFGAVEIVVAVLIVRYAWKRQPQT